MFIELAFLGLNNNASNFPGKTSILFEFDVVVLRNKELKK